MIKKVKIFIVFVSCLPLCSMGFAINFNDTTKYVIPENGYEYIPAEADYDLIKDRLSCIEDEIPLNFNTRVSAFINYFTVKDREYTHKIIRRKNLYFPLFEKYLKKYGLPDHLKYLSIIESALNPKAVSRARAVGLWQFMSATGRQFGLHNDWYIDERMNPEKSTEAACKYLKQLYNMFGDWELAIAAYNTGPGNIRKAIRRSGYKRKFWEIYPKLYRETRSYLPQFVAMIYVLNYTEEHNFTDDSYEYHVDTDTINVDHYVHLPTLEKQLSLCKGDLKKINPSLKRGVLPDIKGGYAIKLPLDAKETLNLNRASILDSASKVGKKEVTYSARNNSGSTYGRDKITYRVRSGDVLGLIAERHHVRVSDLKAWNNLRGNTIKIGQRLNIWLKPGYQTVTSTKKVSRKIISLPDGSRTYVVQPGDTLWDISRKFEGLSIEKLKSLNQMKSNKIKPGQKLIVKI